MDYYTRLAGETNLPLLMYATQKTVALDVNGIIDRLLAVPNIVGAKDTRANYYKMWQLKQLNGGDVNVINGPDETLICGLMMGADGGIGSTYNVMPRWFSELFKAFRAGKIDEARAIQTKINYGIQALLRLGRGNTVRSVKAALTESVHAAGRHHRGRPRSFETGGAQISVSVGDGGAVVQQPAGATDVV